MQASSEALPAFVEVWQEEHTYNSPYLSGRRLLAESDFNATESRRLQGGPKTISGAI
jgi:hypothetical protein